MANFDDGELATIAERLRKAAGFRPMERLDVAKLVGKFELATDKNVKITFREASPGYIRGALAQAQPKERRVLYSEGLLAKAIVGDRNASYVFLEEIAHVVLRHDARVLNHSIGADIKVKSNFEIELMEDEAKKLVWYLQAPISEVFSIKDRSSLISLFGMTEQAAQQYFSHIVATREGFEKKDQLLPSNVLRFERSSKVSLSTTVSLKDAANENLRPKNPKNDPVSAKTQYSAFSHIPCRNCGKMSVIIQSGCQHCIDCGEEDGC